METVGPSDPVYPRRHPSVLLTMFSMLVGKVFTPLMVVWFVVGWVVKPLRISLPTVGFCCAVMWLARFLFIVPFEWRLEKGAREMAKFPALKPYRFGVVFAFVQVAASVRFMWMASYHAQGWQERAGIMLWALFEAALGVGILRRRYFGVILLGIWIALTLYHPLVDWWKMPWINMVYYSPVVFAFIVAGCATVAYFWKRRSEFTMIPLYF